MIISLITSVKNNKKKKNQSIIDNIRVRPRQMSTNYNRKKNIYFPDLLELGYYVIPLLLFITSNSF